jgi:hypothetical protein
MAIFSEITFFYSLVSWRVPTHTKRQGKGESIRGMVGSELLP